MEVEIFGIKDGDKASMGKIRLQGGRLQAEGNLSRLLEHSIRNIKTGEQITAEEDPEDFLENLQYHLRSPYLHAGAPNKGMTLNKVRPSPFRSK